MEIEISLLIMQLVGAAVDFSLNLKNVYLGLKARL